MHPLHDLSPGPKPPKEITVVVEIPKGSRNKYELDKDTGLYRLDRTLFSPMIYPGDYGLVPQTHYDDGDPLDVLILGNEPTFTGCIVDVRPIGMFRMLDKGDHDDKVLAVPIGNPFFRNFHDLIDVPPHFLDEVAHFFTVYKDLEGTRTHPLGWEPVDVARERIMVAIQMYKDKRAAEEAEKAGDED